VQRLLGQVSWRAHLRLDQGVDPEVSSSVCAAAGQRAQVVGGGGRAAPQVVGQLACDSGLPRSASHAESWWPSPPAPDGDLVCRRAGWDQRTARASPRAATPSLILLSGPDTAARVIGRRHAPPPAGGPNELQDPSRF
jgi:hypothetical protein